jgi:hypothetical protein
VLAGASLALALLSARYGPMLALKLGIPGMERAPAAPPTPVAAWTFVGAALVLSALSIVLTFVWKPGPHLGARVLRVIVVTVSAVAVAYALNAAQVTAANARATMQAYSFCADTFDAYIAQPKEGPVKAKAVRAIHFEAVATFNGKDVSDRIRFVWKFGDGGTGTGRKTTHVYGKDGEYDISMTADFSDLTGGVTEATVYAPPLTTER